MPRRLSDKDFRARRVILTRGDFGLAPRAAPRATDRVDKPTWSGIVTLPDDVAIRTSNYHGTTLRQLYDLWGAWVESAGMDRDLLFPAMLDAGDDFESSTYAALTGFYRLSVSALRSALEVVTIATWAQVTHADAGYLAWRRGEATLQFGQACDGLIAPTRKLRERLTAAVRDTLFDPRRPPSSEGGLARRLFAGLSDFAHSRPGFSDGDFRQSNGPIYVDSAFKHVSWLQFETRALCFFMVLLARPHAKFPPAVMALLKDSKRVKSRVVQEAFEALY